MVTVQAQGSPIVVLVDHRDLTRVALLRSFSEGLPGVIVIAVIALADVIGHATNHLRAVILHIDAVAEEGALRATIAAARDALHGVPVVTLSEGGDEASLQAAIGGGASAHLTTSMPLDLAAATIRIVMLGGTSFPARFAPPARINAGRLAAPLQARQSNGNGARPSGERLTLREEEVLKLVGRGAQNKMIAFMLNMSENTVKVHLHRILQKFHLHNRTEAALFSHTYFAAETALALEPQMMARGKSVAPPSAA